MVSLKFAWIWLLLFSPNLVFAGSKQYVPLSSTFCPPGILDKLDQPKEPKKAREEFEALKQELRRWATVSLNKKDLPRVRFIKTVLDRLKDIEFREDGVAQLNTAYKRAYYIMFNEVIRVCNQNQKLVSIAFVKTQPEQITLDLLVSSPAGIKGGGTQVIRELVSKLLADEKNPEKTIDLISVSEAESFYKKMGFKLVKPASDESLAYFVLTKKRAKKRFPELVQSAHEPH